MRNLPKIFWNSSTAERLQNKVGIVTKLKKKLDTKNQSIGMAILAYERPEYLEVSLDSLFHTNLYDYDITFFICDYGSKDPRVKQIIEKMRDKEYKIVRWYFKKGPYSAGAAINRATKEMLKYEKFDIIRAYTVSISEAWSDVFASLREMASFATASERDCVQASGAFCFPKI